MAGKGPAPKDGAARRNKRMFRVVPAATAEQPALPDFTVQIDIDGEITEQTFDWPERTREWWRMWSEHPLSTEFSASDWEFLLDTARIHAEFWRGNMKVANELRLRVQKFGATPEDRARLLVSFAPPSTDDDTQDSDTGKSTSREMFGGLSAVG